MYHIWIKNQSEDWRTTISLRPLDWEFLTFTLLKHRHKWSDLLHSTAHFVFTKNKLSNFLHLGLQSELNILKDKETFPYCMIWSPVLSGFQSSRLMFSYCRNTNQRSTEQGLDCLLLRWLVSWCSVLLIDFKELPNSTHLLSSIILCFSFPLYKLTIGLKW